MHINGGSLFSGSVNNVDECLLKCSSDPTCQAVDYNSADKGCYKHTSLTSCGTLVSKADCVHYKQIACKPDSYNSAFAGFHIQGGALQMSLSELDDCIGACTNNTNCHGLDFNGNEKTCWFHSSATACNIRIPKASCSNYRKFSCSVTTTTVPTTPTTSNTPTPTTSTTSTATTTTVASTTTQAGLPAGFVSAYPGRNIIGGTLQQGVTDLTTCLNNCLLSSTTCLGIDYNAYDNSCWFHTAVTECTTLQNKTGCTHFRRANICPASSTTTTTMVTTTASVPNGYMSSAIGMHIIGGERQSGTFANVDQCLAACNASPTCQAVDYNSIELSCWSHTSVTACNAQIVKAGCSNYRRGSCTTSTSTTATTTSSTASTVTPSTATTTTSTIAPVISSGCVPGAGCGWPNLEPNTAYVPDPSSSSRFCQCSPSGWVVMECPVGLNWNNDINSCDYPNPYK